MDSRGLVSASPPVGSMGKNGNGLIITAIKLAIKLTIKLKNHCSYNKQAMTDLDPGTVVFRRRRRRR